MADSFTFSIRCIRQLALHCIAYWNTQPASFCAIETLKNRLILNQVVFLEITFFQIFNGGKEKKTVVVRCRGFDLAIHEKTYCRGSLGCGFLRLDFGSLKECSQKLLTLL